MDSNEFRFDNSKPNVGKASHANQEGSINSECDESEGEKTEATLAFHANLLSNVHDAVVAVNEHFLITYWNKMAEEMFGWTAKEAIGQSSDEMFQVKLDGLSREEGIKKLLMDSCYRGEAGYRRKDGSYVLTDFRSTVLRGSKGEFAGVLTSLRDITESKQMREKLEEYAKNLERLVEERTEKMRKSEESYRELYESFDEGS